MDIVQNAFLQALGLFGGAAVVLAALSGWLGKVWAERILQSENRQHQERLKKIEADLRHSVDTQLAQLQVDLAMLKEKTIKAHTDKLACYADAVDGTAKLLTDISAIAANLPSARSFAEAFAEFDASRIKAYGHMALVAPQAVMDAYDLMVDYFIHVSLGREKPEWARARSLALNWINAARADIGVDSTPIAYKGAL